MLDQIDHDMTDIYNGTNSGLCDKCNDHTEVTWSFCVCGDRHTWCKLCWWPNGWENR